MPRWPSRPPNEGLRDYLLAEERELYETITWPPRTPIDGRPPTMVDPAVQDALEAAFGGRVRGLAEGWAYQLRRSDLPPRHRLRGVGEMHDLLTLTEDDELIEDASRLAGSSRCAPASIPVLRLGCRRVLDA
jgi:hypothetical protein